MSQSTEVVAVERRGVFWRVLDGAIGIYALVQGIRLIADAEFQLPRVTAIIYSFGFALWGIGLAVKFYRTSAR